MKIRKEALAWKKDQSSICRSLFAVIFLHTAQSTEALSLAHRRVTWTERRLRKSRYELHLLMIILAELQFVHNECLGAYLIVCVCVCVSGQAAPRLIVVH